MIARKMLRPMRPKPLIANLTVIIPPFDQILLASKMRQDGDLSTGGAARKRYRYNKKSGPKFAGNLTPEGQPFDDFQKLAAKENQMFCAIKHDIDRHSYGKQQAQNNRECVGHGGVASSNGRLDMTGQTV
jgi:hypothetical protein